MRLDHENTIKPIRTEKDYDAALKEVERPMDPPHPIEAIKFRMEQQGLTRRDLEPLIGTRTRVAEVLDRRRGLSIEMIRRLHETLGISAEILIRPSRRDRAAWLAVRRRSSRG